MKKIALIIFYFIKLVHNFFLKLFKKNLLIYFKEHFEKNLITNLNIKDKNISLFTPNHSSFWRANQFLTREPDTIEWIESFNENTNFWDIGACVGQFSIFSCKFKNTDVLCFEPSTSNLRILSRNIFLNNLQNKIKILPIALNDHDDFSLFNEHKFVEAGALNTVVRDDENKDCENQYNIFSITINTLVTKHLIKKPNYIKIDVDGKEYDILKNANEILKSNELESLLIEIDTKSKDYNNLFSLMNKFGFKEDKSYEKKMNKNYREIRNFIFRRYK